MIVCIEVVAVRPTPPCGAPRCQYEGSYMNAKQLATALAQAILSMSRGCPAWLLGFI